MQRIGRRCIRNLAVAGLVSALCGSPASVLAAETTRPPPAPDEGAVARAAELTRVGRFDEAVLAWRDAARSFEAAGNARERASALVRLAEAQQALGRYEESLRTLSEALDAAGDGAEPALLAAIHGSIGNAYLALGPPERAREHLSRSLELAKAAGDPGLAAAALANLGNLDASQDAYAEASRAYAESGALAEKAGDVGLAARVHANAARTALRAGAPAAEVRAGLERAARLAGGLPDSHDKAYLLISVGRCHAQLAAEGRAQGARDLEQAHTLLRRAQEVAEATGDSRALSYALGYLGSLYEERGRPDEALGLTRRALVLAQEANAPESLYRWHWQAGRILAAKRATAEAIASYQQAVAVLQGIRFDLAHGYATGEGSFRDTVGAVFFELVDLLLETAPDPADAAAYQARLLAARETVEQVKAAELRDYFGDECVDALEAKVERLDQVAASAVVIYPVILPERLELLLTFPTGMRRATVPIGAEVLTAEVRELRYLLEKRTTREYLPHAQRLYEWLVRPFEADLAGLPVDTLVFVPDGPLRTVPMSALHDGERFVVERYAVAETPGLSLTDPRPLDRENLRVFASGLSQSVQGFPPLEHVPAELASIHALFGGEVLLDDAFRVPRVEGSLGAHEFGIVHVASHGEFAGDAEHSFLLTYDGRLTMGQLGATVRRTRLRERPIELLALSACETAQGNDRAALGLAGVAVQAGARSALGTLWSVNDAAAAELMVEFYRQIREAPVSKAVALQRAQRKLLAEPSYGHPFYWSPYLLISNWL